MEDDFIYFLQQNSEMQGILIFWNAFADPSTSPRGHP
jgi:hypothetical protein